MNKIYFLIFSILILFQSVSNSQLRIASINFIKLTKTDPLFLKQFLELKVGNDFDSLKLVRDEQFLMNLQYFKDVTSSVKTEGENTNVTFYLKEKITVLPIVNFNFIKENVLVRFGITDLNFLGSWNSIGGYYQYYERSSFEIFQRTPYLFGSRFGVATRIAKFSTIEPAYFVNGKTYFNVDRNVIGFLFSYDFSKEIGYGTQLTVSLGAEYLDEIYIKNNERSGIFSPGLNYDERKKLLLKSSFVMEEIDYFSENTNGYSNRIYYEVVFEKNDVIGFHKILNEFRLFKKIGSTNNLALRFRMGISTNKKSPFIPFVVDNYINVRGIGDRVARGSAELTLNLEFRHTLKSLSWVAVQLIGFSDISAIRPGGSSLTKLFNHQNVYSTAGIGLRVHLFDFYNVIFRLDYGMNIEQPEKRGFVIGMNQYF